MRDFGGDLADVRRRIDEAAGYLKIDAARVRLAELEIKVARPDLWDDQDHAKKVNSEYSNVSADVTEFDRLVRSIDDLDVLHEMAREIDDESQESEIEQGIAALRRALDDVELRSLFTGEHDTADAIIQINAKDGGVDAQDWSSMLLRMYTRWAERRSFSVEMGDVSQGTEAGILSADFTVRGRYAYGLLTSERGTHRLVRISPFDNQGRRQTSFATVQVWPVLDEPDVEINEADIDMEVFSASHPPSDGTRRIVAAGTQPVAEPRECDEEIAHDARHAYRRGARGRTRTHRRKASDGRLGNPDPLVRPAAVPDGEGSAHRRRDG